MISKWNHEDKYCLNQKKQLDKYFSADLKHDNIFTGLCFENQDWSFDHSRKETQNQ